MWRRKHFVDFIVWKRIRWNKLKYTEALHRHQQLTSWLIHSISNRYHLRHTFTTINYSRPQKQTVKSIERNWGMVPTATRRVKINTKNHLHSKCKINSLAENFTHSLNFHRSKLVSNWKTLMKCCAKGGS